MRVLASLVIAFAVVAFVPRLAAGASPSTETVVVNGGAAGFSWGDAGIGAAAGFGTAVALWGVIVLRRIR